MLWLLTRIDAIGQYHVNGKVVRADDETEARHLANECLYADGRQGISKPNCDPIWNDADLVRCTALDSSNKKGILMLK